MVPSGEPREKSPVTPPGIDTGTSRLVAQCLNHYATPGPVCYVILENKATKMEQEFVDQNYVYFFSFPNVLALHAVFRDISPIIHVMLLKQNFTIKDSRGKD